MDRNRAQEIINSITMINVNFHGFPVYLKEINSDQTSATIFPLDEMNHEQNVDLEGLSESGP